MFKTVLHSVVGFLQNMADRLLSHATAYHRREHWPLLPLKPLKSYTVKSPEIFRFAVENSGFETLLLGPE